jgi:hypothetical protein
MIAALLAATILMANSSAFQATPPSIMPSTVSPVVVSPDSRKQKVQDADAVVCRNEPVLGSRMSVKRCATPRQMAMEKFEAQQDLSKAQAKDGYHH